jgi:acetyl esterase
MEKNIANIRLSLNRKALIARGEKYDRYSCKIDETWIKVGGPKYHPGAKIVEAIHHYIKGRERKNRKCMVYFHSGGGYGGSPDLFAPITNRYALEGDVDIISVQYRLAPEEKLPAGVFDGYAAVKWVLENAESMGIHPKKIGMFGDSFGAMIAAGVGMIMAENNEGDIIKF